MLKHSVIECSCKKITPLNLMAFTQPGKFPLLWYHSESSGLGELVHSEAHCVFIFVPRLVLHFSTSLSGVWNMMQSNSVIQVCAVVFSCVPSIEFPLALRTRIQQ